MARNSCLTYQKTTTALTPIFYTTSALEILKNAMEMANIKWQQVPPGQHRRNAAERAICTFKNFFVVGLAICDPSFPIREWDRLLPGAELCLNLLRNSRINPKLSAWSYLFGQFDFNRTPLAPPGTELVIHEKPDKRKS